MFQEDSPIYENISANWGRRRGFVSSADQDTRVVEEEDSPIYGNVWGGRPADQDSSVVEEESNV